MDWLFQELCQSQGLVEMLKIELDKKVLTLKQMQLEIGTITMKYITSYQYISNQPPPYSYLFTSV